MMKELRKKTSNFIEEANLQFARIVLASCIAGCYTRTTCSKPFPTVLPNRTVRICTGTTKTKKNTVRFVQKTTSNSWEFKLARLVADHPTDILPKVYRCARHNDKYTMFFEFLPGSSLGFPPPETVAQLAHEFSTYGEQIVPKDWRRPKHYAPIFTEDFLNFAGSGDPKGAKHTLKEIVSQKSTFQHNDLRERNLMKRSDGTDVLIDFEMASENLVGAEFHHSALKAIEIEDHIRWHESAIASFSERAGISREKVRATANLYAAARSESIWKNKNIPLWRRRAKSLFQLALDEWRNI